MWKEKRSNNDTFGEDEIYTSKNNRLTEYQTCENKNDESLESCLYLSDENKHIFRLNFTTFNIKMEFIKIANRRAPEENGKYVQTCPRSRYHMEFPPDDTFHHLYLRNDLFKGSRKRRHVKSNKTKHDNISKPTRTHDISKTSKEVYKNEIFLNIQNITFRVNIKDPLSILYVKPVYNGQRSHKDPEKEMETYCRERRNTGKVKVCYKNDTISFTFNILNPKIERIQQYTSRGVGLDRTFGFNNSLVYFRYFSPINDRIVYCPLPRSTYYYEYPIWKRDSKTPYSRKESPSRIKDGMKKIVKKQRSQTKKCADEKKDEMGTSLLVEVRRHYVRAKSAQSKLVVISGNEFYEKLVISEQMKKFPFLKKATKKLHTTPCPVCEALSQEDIPQIKECKPNPVKQYEVPVKAYPIDADVCDWYIVDED